jgi:hypothetical protein
VLASGRPSSGMAVVSLRLSLARRQRRPGPGVAGRNLGAVERPSSTTTIVIGRFLQRMRPAISIMLPSILPVKFRRSCPADHVGVGIDGSLEKEAFPPIDPPP